MSAKLPYHLVNIKIKDFDHDPKYKQFKGDYGWCNMGENCDEIWINKNKLKLPSDTMALTEVHELCHVRRQNAGEEYKNNRKEDDAVELEAIARTPNVYLNQAQKIIKKYLTVQIIKSGRKTLDPDLPNDLQVIHKKIKTLLKFKYRK